MTSNCVDKPCDLPPRPTTSKKVAQVVETAQLSDAQKQNASKTLLTWNLSAQVIADWMLAGENMKETWLGQAEHWVLPEHSNITSFDKSKPQLQAFLEKWQYLAGTGDYQSSEEIFKVIMGGNSDAAEGGRIFQSMLNGNSRQHNLGYTHYQAINNFIAAEKINTPAARTLHILDSTNRYLLTNGESYGAAFAIGEMYAADPQHGALAKIIMARAQIQPGFDQFLQVFDTNNPLPLLAVAGVAKGVLAVGQATVRGSVAIGRLLRQNVISGKQFTALSPYLTSVALHAGGGALVLNQGMGASNTTPSYSEDQPQITNEPLASTPEPEYVAQLKASENDNAPRLKTKQELIQEAQQKLMDYERKVKVDGYGNFFVQSELIENPEQGNEVWPEMHEQLVSDDTRYKRIVAESSTSSEQMEALRQDLYRHYLAVYSRDQTLVTGLFNGAGGNCEAQTKIVIEAFQASGIQLPKDQVLGVQVFSDHVQPVVYNKSTGEVIDLVSGDIKKTVVSDIYAPPIFFHAYLKKQNVSPSVSEKDLLIVKGPESKSTNKQTPQTNTNLTLPTAANTFNLGEVPERAYLAYRTMAAIVSNPIANLQSKQNPSERSLGAATPSQELHDYTELIQKDNPYYSGLEYQTNGRYHRFATEEQRAHYNSLVSAADRNDFVHSLNRLSLSKLLASPAYAISLDILKNPANTSNYSPEELQSAVKLVGLINEISENAERTFANIARIFDQNAAAMELLSQTTPALKALIKLEKKFYKKITENPKALSSLLNTLPPEKQTALLDLPIKIGYGLHRRSESERSFEIAFGEYIADPKNISVAENRMTMNAGMKTTDGETYDLATAKQTQKEIDEIRPPVWDGACGNSNGYPSRGFFIVCEKPALETQIKSQTKQVADVVVAPETMINLIFNFQRNDVAKRWTPELSKAFLEMNSDGKYDKQFLSMYRTIAYNRAQGDNMEPNPYYDERTGNTDPLGRFGDHKMNMAPRTIPADIAEILKIIKRRETSPNI